jgi:hypothetical protein
MPRAGISPPLSLRSFSIAVWASMLTVMPFMLGTSAWCTIIREYSSRKFTR